MRGRGTGRIAFGSAVAAALIVLLGLAACGKSDTGGGEPAAAERSRSAAAATALSNPAYQAYRLRAQQAMQGGNFAEALEAARIAVELAPLAREPYQAASIIFVQSGRHKEGLDFFSELARKHPDLGHAWYFKGFHEFLLDHWDAARTALERAVEQSPDDSESHFRLGTTLHTTGEFERALEAFRRAYELDPNSPTKAAMLGRALRIFGNYDAAEQTIVTALERTPNASELHYALAQLKIRQGRDQEAEQRLRRAVELNPALGKAHNDLARLLMRAGQEDEARVSQARSDRSNDYERLKRFLLRRIKLLPDHPDVPMMLAELELTARRNPDALRWFARSENLGGSAERIAGGRAWVFFAHGDRNRGQAELDKLAGWDDPRADLARAAQAVLDRQPDRAADLLDRAVARGPGDKVFLAQASDLYVYAGRTERAEELLIRASSAPHPSAPKVSALVNEAGEIIEIQR